MFTGFRDVFGRPWFCVPHIFHLWVYWWNSGRCICLELCLFRTGKKNKIILSWMFSHQGLNVKKRLEYFQMIVIQFWARFGDEPDGFPFYSEGVRRKHFWGEGNRLTVHTVVLTEIAESSLEHMCWFSKNHPRHPRCMSYLLGKISQTSQIPQELFPWCFVFRSSDRYRRPMALTTCSDSCHL